MLVLHKYLRNEILNVALFQQYSIFGELYKKNSMAAFAVLKTFQVSSPLRFRSASLLTSLQSLFSGIANIYASEIDMAYQLLVLVCVVQPLIRRDAIRFDVDCLLTAGFLPAAGNILLHPRGSAHGALQAAGKGGRRLSSSVCRMFMHWADIDSSVVCDHYGNGA